MIDRSSWIEKIKRAWEKRPVVWLSGVRRVGKTTLAKMLQDAVYLNCDLPSVIRRLEDPESFYDSIQDRPGHQCRTCIVKMDDLLTSGRIFSCPGKINFLFR